MYTIFLHIGGLKFFSQLDGEVEKKQQHWERPALPVTDEYYNSPGG
jgi:hypothetical protein